MANKCSCPGAVCTCGVDGVVKDGHGVRRSMLSMDGHPRVTMSDADRAYYQMKDDLSRAHLQPSTPSKAAARGAHEASVKEARDHAFAEARAAGHNDAVAREYAARQGMIHDQANAWRI